MSEPIVYLIGAGPGDPELITVRGLQCLADADVVLYDHLVHPRLLREAKPTAEKIDVGMPAPHRSIRKPSATCSRRRLSKARWWRA
ncbi:MAG: SAM-dependent methyltransferase [Vicinamibacterales bacterium]